MASSTSSSWSSLFFVLEVITSMASRDGLAAPDAAGETGADALEWSFSLGCELWLFLLVTRVNVII